MSRYDFCQSTGLTCTFCTTRSNDRNRTIELSQTSLADLSLSQDAYQCYREAQQSGGMLENRAIGRFRSSLSARAQDAKN
jgi:hypothetical protein